MLHVSSISIKEHGIGKALIIYLTISQVRQLHVGHLHQKTHWHCKGGVCPEVHIEILFGTGEKHVTSSAGKMVTSLSWLSLVQARRKSATLQNCQSDIN